MADLIIAPEGYTTPGGVPRKLLAGVFIVVSLVAMAVFLLTSRDEPLMTGDQKARAELGKPESISAQQKGHAAWVDEAVEQARADSSAERDAPRQPVGPLGHKGGPALPRQPSTDLPLPGMASHGPAPLPVGGKPAMDDASFDSAAVERERAARGAAATVFDDGGPVTAKAEGTAPDLARRIGALMPPGAESMAPVIEAIKATQGGAAPAPSRAEVERQWAQGLPGTSAGNHPLRARLPPAELMLQQGTVIPCVLTRRINSDLPGVVTARVSMDVYDSLTSRRLLLPKGALLVGAYNSDVRQGQSRLQFAFTQMKMPDGSTFDLPGATGSDAAGQAGVTGDVDRHFVRNFGAALLLGVLADRVTRINALPNGGAAGQGGVSATGQVFVDTARAELERHKDIPPTVTIEEGARLNVEVVRDMAFPTVFGEQLTW